MIDKMMPTKRDPKHERWLLNQRQQLPLDTKISMSLDRIREWCDHYAGYVCVSFSGGKDSSVLLHLVRGLYPDVVGVFADTGLEFPEIREHVKATTNVIWVRPKKSFRAVIEQQGYPVVSKRVAQYVGEAQRGAATKSKTWHLRMYGETKAGKPSPLSKIPEKWKYLVDAPFKISDGCCRVLKKAPMGYVQSKLGLHPILGTRAGEAEQRTQTYLRVGCNAFGLASPRSTPLAFWTGADIDEYIRMHDVPISPIYTMGYERTGCMFCAFGAHLEQEPNRFQRLEQTHPKQWAYCMDKMGMRKVLRHISVPCSLREPGV